MPPTRYWKIECLNFLKLDFAALGVQEGERGYFIVSVDGRLLGRSPLLPRDTQAFSFQAQDHHWFRQKLFTSNSDASQVEIRVQLYSDREDRAPLRLLNHLYQIEVRHGDTPRTETTKLLFVGGAELFLASWSVKIPTAATLQVLAPRSTTGGTGTAQATVEPPGAAITQITRVRGLYKPGHRLLGLQAPKLAEYCAGYKSEDDLGRIYLSRDLDGTWTPDTELIELTAQVTLVNRRAETLGIKWMIFEPLDPVLMRYDVHRQARPILEGDSEGDNEGPWPDVRWTEVEDFDLVAQEDDTAITRCRNGESRILVACPKTAGDRFLVRAVAASDTLRDGLDGGVLVHRLSLPSGFAPQLNVGDETGVMTMWHRVDVEYRVMEGAFDLPVADVAQHYEPACIQLDFTPQQSCAESKDYLGDHTADIDELASAFVDQEFADKNVGGTFCLLSIKQFLEPPESTPKSSSVAIGHWELAHLRDPYNDVYYDYVDVSPEDVENFKGLTPDRAYFSWFNETGEERDRSFGIADSETLDEGWMRYYLQGFDVTKAFDGRTMDGNNAEDRKISFLPTGYQEEGEWYEGGFEIPPGEYRRTKKPPVYLEMGLPGNYTYSGWSPSAKHNGKLYFAGRTVLATLDQQFAAFNFGTKKYRKRGSFKEDAVITIIHELAHGFGLPHCCAEWDYRTPRRQSCVMNYSEDWMIGEDRVPVWGTKDHVGREFCAIHIKELRRIRFERNPALSAAWQQQDVEDVDESL